MLGAEAPPSVQSPHLGGDWESSFSEPHFFMETPHQPWEQGLQVTELAQRGAVRDLGGTPGVAVQASCHHPLDRGAQHDPPPGGSPLHFLVTALWCPHGGTQPGLSSVCVCAHRRELAASLPEEAVPGLPLTPAALVLSTHSFCNPPLPPLPTAS